MSCVLGTVVDGKWEVGDRTSSGGQLLRNARRFPMGRCANTLNVLPTNLKLGDDKSIVDQDISIATSFIQIVSRSIALGLAVGEIAIAHLNKGILPINNGFCQVPISVGANANATQQFRGGWIALLSTRSTTMDDRTTGIS